MHSRHYLTDADFALHYATRDGEDRASKLKTGWEPRDRVAFVAEDSESGIRSCGGAVLLLTHWFYRREEAGESDFFDYPQRVCTKQC